MTGAEREPVELGEASGSACSSASLRSMRSWWPSGWRQAQRCRSRRWWPSGRPLFAGPFFGGVVLLGRQLAQIDRERGFSLRAARRCRRRPGAPTGRVRTTRPCDRRVANRQLVRIGIDRPSGAATGGPDRWSASGDHHNYPVVDFEQAASRANGSTILDVRRSDERTSYIDGSLHVELPDLVDQVGRLPDRPLWVHCATGFRASIATSLLDRAGRTVVLIDDDYEHASRAGLPILTP